MKRTKNAHIIKKAGILYDMDTFHKMCIHFMKITISLDTLNTKK